MPEEQNLSTNKMKFICGKKTISKTDGRKTNGNKKGKPYKYNKKTCDLLTTRYIRNQGNKALTCKKFKISRSTFDIWYKTYPEFREAIDDANESFIDNSESVLRKSILKGNITANIFYLKTKGKSRGYDENSTPIIMQDTNVDLSKLSVEQLKLYVDLLKIVQK